MTRGKQRGSSRRQARLDRAARRRQDRERDRDLEGAPRSASTIDELLDHMAASLTKHFKMKPRVAQLFVREHEAEARAQVENAGVSLRNAYHALASAEADLAYEAAGGSE